MAITITYTRPTARSPLAGIAQGNLTIVANATVAAQVPMVDAGNQGPLKACEFRRVSLIHRNREAALGETVTLYVYGSNFAVKQTTLVNIQLYSDELTGGGLALAPDTNDDITELLSLTNGFDYQSVLTNYEWVYLTLQSGVGATAADNQFLEWCLKT